LQSAIPESHGHDAHTIRARNASKHCELRIAARSVPLNGINAGCESMKVKTVLLGTVAALAIGGSANAAHLRGWYIGLEGGANWVQDFDVQYFRGPTGGATTFTLLGTFEMDTGWAGIATIGYGFGDHWRVELEGGYRHNEVDQFRTVTGPSTTTPIIGELSEWTIMANVVYDLMLTSRFGLSLGVGAGADHAQFENRPQPPNSSNNFDDGEWNFAYQGLVGLNYSLTRRAQLGLNYRYLRVSEPEWHGTAPGPDFLRFESEDLSKHTLTLALRYALSAPDEPVQAAPPPPPPEPPPPPPEEPTTSFLIFFGFNKCNITPEADEVLSQAASTAKSLGSASIVIVGHTDTSGSARYNQRLSECRARAARTNLVDKGISAGAITTSGKGETELMVQTGDGVKEPQNRRTSVDLH
jgi:OmpA-OmpF porin, OOP family